MKKGEKTFAQISGTEGIRKNLKRKSIQGAVFMASGAGIDFLLRFGSAIVLARMLNPEDFGLVAMVLAVTAFTEQIRDLGLPAATIQSREITHEQVTNLFWVNLAGGALFGTLFSGAAPLIAGFYKDQRLVPVTLAIATNFLWSGLTTQHQALLCRQLKQGRMVAVRAGANFLSIVLAVFLAANHFGYWALTWREVARNFLIAAGMWLACAWRPGLPSRNGDIRRLLGFGAQVALNDIITVTVSSLDRLLIGKFFGASPVGIYRQAQQLILAPMEQLNTPIISVSEPALAMLQSDPQRYRRFYRQMLHLLSLLTMPVGLFSAIYAREITLVLLGPKWIDAAGFITIFGLVASLRPSLATCTLVLVTCGRSKRLLSFSAIESTTLVLFMVAGLKWGPLGIASASLCTMIVLLFPKLFYSFRRTPATVSLFFEGIGMPLVASGVMVAALLSFRTFASADGYLVSLASGAVVAAVSYAAALLLFPRGRRELNSLRSDVLAALDRRRPATAEKA
jgi:polysaccharide transporter, PST family